MLWTAALRRRSSFSIFWRARTAARRHARGPGRGRGEKGHVRRKDLRSAAEKATKRTTKKSGGVTVQTSLVQGKKQGRSEKMDITQRHKNTEKNHQAPAREQECLGAL